MCRRGGPLKGVLLDQRNKCRELEKRDQALQLRIAVEQKVMQVLALSKQ
jgi:hypothetical protein